jgi:ribose/xylose/arabinose/galactoside ABC-type transport system permease subunit
MSQPPSPVVASFAPPPRPPSARPEGVSAHLGWEAILLVGVLATAVLVASNGTLFQGSMPWWRLATVGLLATGFALSLRTATPNLAVGAIAVLAGAVYAEIAQDGGSGVLAGAVAVVVALVLGLVLGAIVGLTSAPAWAVTLGGMAVAQSITLGMLDGLSIPVPRSTAGTGMAVLWTFVFLAVSIGGGVLWLVPGVRKVLTTNRTLDDPVRYRQTNLIGALAGLGGSSALAGLSGVVVVTYLGAANLNGGENLPYAVAAALLGGVSAFGGRGGIAGTALAVTLLVFANYGLVQTEAPGWVVYYLPAALAILIGVVVSRMLEARSGPFTATPPPAVPGLAPPPGLVR